MSLSLGSKHCRSSGKWELKAFKKGVLWKMMECRSAVAALQGAPEYLLLASWFGPPPQEKKKHKMIILDVLKLDQVLWCQLKDINFLHALPTFHLLFAHPLKKKKKKKKKINTGIATAGQNCSQEFLKGVLDLQKVNFWTSI